MVDAATVIGKILITVLAGIAEFEADLIKECQIEDIAAATKAPRLTRFRLVPGCVELEVRARQQLWRDLGG